MSTTTTIQQQREKKEKRLTPEDLKKYKSGERFINGLPSEATQAGYTFSLEKYMEFLNVGKNPDLLIKQARQRDDGVKHHSQLEIKKYVENNLIEWIIQLKSSVANGAKSIRRHIHAVASFYVLNGVVEMINFKKLSKFLPPNHKSIKDRAYTLEEIKKLIESADERTKVIILLMSSSGMRLGALEGLKFGDLAPIEDFYKITVYQGFDEEYETFRTPECRAAIDSYIEFRKRLGETVTKASPLLREEFNIDDRYAAAANPKPLTKRGISSSIWRHAYKKGMRSQREKKDRTQVYLLHGLRKYFNTQMNNAKVNPIRKEVLMGHSVGLDNSYDRPTEDQLLEEYKTAIPYLTISQKQKLNVKVEGSEQTKEQQNARLVEVEREKKELEQKLQTIEDNEKQTMSQLWEIVKRVQAVEKKFLGINNNAKIEALEKEISNIDS